MTEAMPFEKIVVPLDGSRWAEKAIPHAEQIARGGGELILLHVYKPIAAQYLGDAMLAGQTWHIEESRRSAEQYVKELHSKIASQQIRVRGYVVESNDMARAVCDFVTAEGADVVVMPAAHQNRLARILMGDMAGTVSGCVNACLLLVRGNLEAEWHEESAKALAMQAAQVALEDEPPADPKSAALMEQLTSLYDAGILSDDEFAAKRAEIEKRL